MLQLKGGFLRTGRSGQWMCRAGGDLVAADHPEAAWYHQQSQPELKLPVPRASPPKIRSGMGGGEQLPLVQALCIPQRSGAVCIASRSRCRVSGRERLSRANLQDLEQQESLHRHPDGLIPAPERVELLLWGCPGDLATAWLCSSSSECRANPPSLLSGTLVGLFCAFFSLPLVHR